MADKEMTNGEPVAANAAEERVDAAEFRGYVKHSMESQKQTNEAFVRAIERVSEVAEKGNDNFAAFMRQDWTQMKADVAFTKGRTAALVYAIGILVAVVGGERILGFFSG